MTSGVYIRTKKPKPISDVTRLKMSVSAKARTDNRNKGKTFSEEWRKNLSKGHKGIMPISLPPHFYGAEHWNWKGGITKLTKRIRTSLKMRQWRDDVFTRDNWTCQDCGVRGTALHAHHVQSFASIIAEYKIQTMNEAVMCEKLWSINNGQTLCEPCHAKTDSYKGKGRILDKGN